MIESNRRERRERMFT